MRGRPVGAAGTSQKGGVLTVCLPPDLNMRDRCARLSACVAGIAVYLVCCLTAVGYAVETTPHVQQISVTSSEETGPIRVAADQARRWQQGSYDVWWLCGNCYLNQGLTYARCREAVLWVPRESPSGRKPNKVLAYFEGDVSISYHRSTPGDASGADARISDNVWFGRFYTFAPMDMRVPVPLPAPAVKPPIFHRGAARFDPQWGRSIQQTQFTLPGPGQAEPVPSGSRRIRAFPRSDVPVNAQWLPSAGGDEWMAVITSGVNLIVDGQPVFVEGVGVIDKIDIETDRMVIWTAGMQPDLNGQTLQSDDTPLEVYLEGNVVFRQGDRVIYARQMYYDVRASMGVILDAELLTPAPGVQGLVRLKSRVLRQLDRSRFVADQALLTTSRLGDPSYYLYSDRITFQDIELPVMDPLTGGPQFDPTTLEPSYTHQRLATSQNNFLYVGDFPILYWPTIATDLEKPNYYIDGFSIRNDNVFGTQVLTDLDAYQLFGVTNPPEGTEWDISLDYLSDRGFGYGTTFGYDRQGFLGVPGPAVGLLDAWFIDDSGTDNLGRGRRNVPPEEKFRGRTFWNHRQQLPNSVTLTAELGWISDRNFLEQYFEREWDEWKDQITGAELKQTFNNQSWSIAADGRLNDFFTQTEWLPRVDHYWLGHPLFGDRLTWFEHTQAAYARLRAAVPPTDPTQSAMWEPLPWQAPLAGERIITRQEIDYPFQLGPVKIVPYALGELAHWGEQTDGDDLQRAYFQAGTRASVPFWAVDPHVENQLLNLHGLAHKVVYDMEFSYADSNRDLDDLSLYDPINDDNIEAFERNFFFTTYGLTSGAMWPARYDPRFYAVRAGLQQWVASPSAEIAEDLTTVRLGMRHRWQTKRGRPGQRRIIDWITLDTNAVWFPEPDRDNFGADFGLVDYDLRWHVGDRLTLVSDGGFDFFADGLRTASVGGFISRPPRGSAYLGIRSFAGPFSSNVINASYSYWMSPKWISTLGSSVALGNAGNIGQTFSITRIGESLLVTLGFNVDSSKDNVGVSLLVEPRFLPQSSLANARHVHVPPPGALGLE